MTQYQIAFGSQGKVNHGDRLALKIRAKINQNIPTADQIDTGEGRVHDQVLAREDAHLTNRLNDLVAALRALEKSRLPFRGELGYWVFLVSSNARDCNAALAQVCAEDLNGDRNGRC